jgi:predicted phosphodiesterase
MSNNLFKKTAVCTDLHIGLKNNSVQHNEDCYNFIKWFCATAKSNNCETAIICGDWHNHRANISILSLNYSMRCLELLNENFDQVYFIAGNHDQYYRENRDVHSLAWCNYLPNVTVINEITKIGDVTLCPWLMDYEYKKIPQIKTKYTFGHFELPYFYMNAQIMMPQSDLISLSDFQSTEHVFSGHFHKRQQRDNITYIGNCFPHNYSDSGDIDRGMMILSWGGKPEYIRWEDQPTYHTFKLSEILDNPQNFLKSNAHVKLYLDVDISYEESNSIKESFIPMYNLRELSMLPVNESMEEIGGQVSDNFQSIDSMINESIVSIESESYDKNLLIQIYNNL